MNKVKHKNISIIKILSRKDWVGHLCACVITAGGIGLMLLIAIL